LAAGFVFAIYSLLAELPISSNMYPELIRPTGEYFAYWNLLLALLFLRF